jgi:hypothetical protein
MIARAIRWALPWLVVVAISASAAYGMTVSVAGAESVAGRETTTNGPVSTELCDSATTWILLNAVSNGWIPARSASYCHP